MQWFSNVRKSKIECRCRIFGAQVAVVSMTIFRTKFTGGTLNYLRLTHSYNHSRFHGSPDMLSTTRFHSLAIDIQREKWEFLQDLETLNELVDKFSFNYSIDPIVVILLEVPPLVPLPLSLGAPSNDCKGPGPSAEGREDSSGHWPSWSSPSCSETRSWSAPRSNPNPSRVVASFVRSGIDSPRTPSSAWPIVRHWTRSADAFPRVCRHCHGRPTSSPSSFVDLQHGRILSSADICRSGWRIGIIAVRRFKCIRKKCYITVL